MQAKIGGFRIVRDKNAAKIRVLYGQSSEALSRIPLLGSASLRTALMRALPMSCNSFRVGAGTHGHSGALLLVIKIRKRLQRVGDVGTHLVLTIIFEGSL